MASEEMLLFFFVIFLCTLAFWLSWQPIKFSGLDKTHIFGRGLLKEHFCKSFVCSEIKKNVYFHFFHYKSMEILSCRSDMSNGNQTHFL